MKSSILALSSLVSVATAICSHGTTLFPRSLNKRDVDIADFGFNELDGPLNWHGLDSDHEKCATGKQQSPIVIYSGETSSVSGSSLTFEVDSFSNGGELLNLGSTLEVLASGKLTRGGKNYDLIQFHFHTPSEHRIDSEFFPMEVHFVFQNPTDESLSVVGFVIEVGTDNQSSALLANVFQHVGDVSQPGTKGDTGPLDFTELENHLQQSEVFQYDGSLTTPSCDEGVAWNVVRDPIYVDVETFRDAKAVMKFNARFTQNQPGEDNLISVAAANL